MNDHTLVIVAAVILPQIVLWAIIIGRMKGQAGAMKHEAHNRGEMVILEPVSASYRGWDKRWGRAESIGRLMLTDRYLVFKRPLGNESLIPLAEVTEVSDTIVLNRPVHTSQRYLALTLVDGSKPVFVLNDAPRWIDEVRNRIGA